jgi:hypothetical protein
LYADLKIVLESTKITGPQGDIFEIDGFLVGSKVAVVVETKQRATLPDVQLVEDKMKDMRGGLYLMLRNVPGAAGLDIDAISHLTFVGVLGTETANEDVMNAVRERSETIFVVVNSGKNYQIVAESRA